MIEKYGKLTVTNLKDFIADFRGLTLEQVYLLREFSGLPNACDCLLFTMRHLLFLILLFVVILRQLQCIDCRQE